jgi:alcohol dehydrogenase
MTMDENWKYLSPTKIVFGLNSFEAIKKYVLAQNVHQKILLVTGKSSMIKHGYVDKIKRLLYDRSIYHFGEVSPNPTRENINEGLKLVGGKNVELVIAMGGGSALDVGKTLAILLNNPGQLNDYLDGKITFEKKGVPFIAIPTTSGTASEVTCWATLWDRESKSKQSLAHSSMFPDYALIDPMLTVHMPPRLTALTGMDALTHAIEACWSQNSQPVSDVFALRAIRLIYKNIKLAYDEPNNFQARSNMSLASLFAGLAFNNTKTAACHSISYPMTANFDIPHGLAVSITIKEVIKFNAKVVPQKINQIIEEWDAASLDEFIEKLVELMHSINLPTRLRDLDLEEKDIETILEDSIYPERMKNNPAQLNKNDIRTILANTF